MTRHNEPSRRKRHSREKSHWYTQPIAWLGIAITIAIIVACVWTVMIGLRYTDNHVHKGEQSILGVPLDSPAEDQDQQRD